MRSRLSRVAPVMIAAWYVSMHLCNTLAHLQAFQPEWCSSSPRLGTGVRWMTCVAKQHSQLCNMCWSVSKCRRAPSAGCASNWHAQAAHTVWLQHVASYKTTTGRSCLHLLVAAGLGIHINHRQIIWAALIWHNGGDVEQRLLGTVLEGVLRG